MVHNEDRSADLLLSDRAGNAGARLGVNQDGEAFLELKDKQGESSFRVAVGATSLGAGAELAATRANAPIAAARDSRQAAKTGCGGSRRMDKPCRQTG